APRLAFEGRSANRRNRRRPKVLYTTRTRPSSLIQVNEKSRELIGPSPWKSWANDYQNSKQNRDQTKQTNEKTINANEYSVRRRDLDLCHGMRQHQHEYYHGLIEKRKPASTIRFPYPDRDPPHT